MESGGAVPLVVDKEACAGGQQFSVGIVGEYRQQGFVGILGGDGLCRCRGSCKAGGIRYKGEAGKPSEQEAEDNVSIHN